MAVSDILAQQRSTGRIDGQTDAIGVGAVLRRVLPDIADEPGDVICCLVHEWLGVAEPVIEGHRDQAGGGQEPAVSLIETPVFWAKRNLRSDAAMD
jgi:hypothetical protein